MYSNMW